jgi:ubiquinone/menaquinone biosynthesis C-methylase UbiE
MRHHRNVALTSIPDRYDRNAEHYGRYWAPVLEAAARRLLDRAERHVRALRRAPVVLDVGTGHGILVEEALRRWPDARLIGSDASSGMLAAARRRHGGVNHADAAEPTDGAAYAPRWLHAPADDLGVPAGSVDLVVSSFAYQLVPDRAAAFAEALRVLRHGGLLCFVTWLDRGPDFEPALEFDEAVYDLDIEEPEEPEEEGRAGDFRSLRAAARELREAGFHRVSAAGDTLVHRWTRDSYLDFKEHYEEQALFAWLEPERARALLERARERLDALPESAFTWAAELVSAAGTRP